MQQLRAPGPLFYSAILESYAPVPDTTRVIASFRVWDAAGDYHHGFALDGVTVQPLMDLEYDLAALPDDIQTPIKSALQKLYLAECGSVQAAMDRAIADGVRF